jgi:hypothetical protein
LKILFAQKGIDMGKRGKMPSNKLPTATATKADAERESRWRAEDDLRTLQRAEEIRGDKERMGHCKSVAKEQMEAASKFAK